MITAEYLRSRLDYDPETGVFAWKAKPGGSRYADQWNDQFAGNRAGSPAKRGYRQIMIDDVNYREHRLAWLYVHGKFPEGSLDHKNLNRSENWIDNLRPATSSQNSANRSKTKQNKSGHKGVSWNRQKQKWDVRLTVAGRRIFLGAFDDVTEAALAYACAAAKHFGEFARFDGL
ncbi:HNH endonuclease [Mesorhizobium sp. M0139]|uniref:HNH endonuclease n=1 Tax=Mesorhizobium sp. M0139 TaxID=2956892 RepID=UPI003335B603